MSNPLEQTLDELNAALKASEETIVAPSLEIAELGSLSNRYLSDGAKEAMKNRSQSITVVKEEDGLQKVYQTVYFTCTTRSENVGKGALEIVKVLNELAEDGLIHSVLSPISTLKLAKVFGKAQQNAVFSFVLVPVEKKAEIEAKYDLATQEGGIGKEIDDTSLDLKEGEFLYEVRVLHQYSMTSTKEDILHNRIEEIKNLLPGTTFIRKVTECNIYDLSMTYEVILYNPLMQNISKIELQYVRSYTRLPFEGIREFNLLVGIQYFDREGKELYK